MISNRHIRHDYREFNDDLTQKTIRTVCGVTTSPKLAGVPGLTRQPVWVYETLTRRRFGWCPRCIGIVSVEVPPGVHKGVREAYLDLARMVHLVRYVYEQAQNTSN